MAIALDALGVGNSSSSASTLTWNHTMGSVSNGILIVHIAHANLGSFNVTGVNWDNAGTPVAMTLLGTFGDAASSPPGHVELWYLKAPASGTKQVGVTISGNTAISANSSSWSGVDQTTPFNASSPQSARGNSGTSQPAVTVTSATGEQVIDVVLDDENGGPDTLVQGGGQTLVYSTPVGTSVSGAGSYAAGAASVNLSWSGITASSNWAEMGASMRPSAGGGGTSFWTMSL